MFPTSLQLRYTWRNVNMNCSNMELAESRLASTRLIAPRQSLASCVRAYIVRSTVETPLEYAADRLNRFPATPLCSIVWFIEGEVEMIEPPPPAPSFAIQRALFLGPQTHPGITYNPGPVRAFMVLFYPQAFHALSGLDVSTLVDFWAPLHDVLDAEWVAMSDAMMAGTCDAARLQILEDFLDTRWGATRTPAASDSASDWLRHLGNQAAQSALGKGTRSIERRIKTWAGQPMRTLRRMRRAEQSFVESRDQWQRGAIAWSDMAERGGYSDQAHQCRETRKITGHSPDELARVLETDDDSYWIYRIWY
jgi:AraC-like DNA-binding protein